jgi:hypothetical protein
MSLDKLVGTRQLQPHDASPESLQRLLAAIRRDLADAKASGISDETRFDAACKSVMRCAMTGLRVAGYRPATSMPGHHQTMIQTLPLTLGVSRERWLVLDAFRRKRNINDYSGDLIDPESVRACLAEAQALFDDTLAWLQQKQPELFRQ